jgi:UDP-N-acetylmuramoylalanine--D-glutamate ligase
MGLGLHGGGAGAAKFFSRLGAKVLVTDLKDKKYLARSLKKLKGLPIKYVLGRHREADFKNADLIIKGPGVPNTSPYLKIARANKVPVDSDVGIFFELCPAPIIGITGTKGKSTTAWLAYRMLARKKRVWLAGNIRTSVFEILPKIKKSGLVVLELSSFQLEEMATHKKSPAVAMVTNVMRDHLDRYRGLKSYVEAKKLIFKFQKSGDWLFLNRDNGLAKSMAGEAPGRVVFFGRSDLKKNKFRKLAAEIKKFPGHIAKNAIAAANIAFLFKIPDNLILAEIKKFRGLEGRGEALGSAVETGIKFINDTCATMPDAAITALKSFAPQAKGGKVILICGGADKNLDFRSFAKILPRYVKFLVLLPGSATEKIKKVLAKLKSPVPGAEVSSMDEAVKKAAENARKNDVILLSPAAASFGLFKNEFDRGEQFKKAIRKLLTINT